MPTSDEAIRRFKRQLAGTRSRTSLLLVTAWDRLGSWDEPDIERFTTATAPTITAAQAAAVTLSAAFFAVQLGTRPVGVTPDDIDVTPDLTGPFHATWHALRVGRPFLEAVAVGRSTTSAVAFDFVQHSARRTGDVVAERSGRTVAWRRVPGGSSCEWCRTVAGQTYRSAEAADFGHERCDCDAVPV